VQFELVALGCGWLASLYAGFRLAEGDVAHPARTLAAFVPWGIVSGVLFALGVWIVLEPMQMRGTLGG
jgi:hypothetical protein